MPASTNAQLNLIMVWIKTEWVGAVRSGLATGSIVSSSRHPYRARRRRQQQDRRRHLIVVAFISSKAATRSSPLSHPRRRYRLGGRGKVGAAPPVSPPSKLPPPRGCRH
ncbi:hypothetical protein PVAP13_6KG301906 [Panicum virgatum]|uniref:Uncharacterized protein n=1 Tax=Panicum virgatum TaxID=38727 RepID=A0A8T0RE81_PANVG|nr:hypothetical protein PVAP13_6KG301906 [Panicum virgatum]